MKLIHSDFKRGEAKIKVESMDDLWYLSNVVDNGDVVKGQTTRKIKIGDKDDRNVKIVKKIITLAIEVEKVEFHKYSNNLRISGTIKEGPEDVSKGSYHTINVEDGTVLKIIKPQWLKYQIEKIKEATETKPPNVIICIFDRENAYIATLKRFGYELLTTLKGNVQKKVEVATTISNFYHEIMEVLKSYSEKLKAEKIIVASPSFWKDEFQKNLKDEDLKKKIVYASCASCDESAINEVLKRKEIEQVLKEDRINKEMKFVEELLSEISKNNLAAYGYKQVEEAVSVGAAKMLLITDSYIQQVRETENYNEIEIIMKTTESTDGKVHIISSDHDGGKKLDGLGGIGAILRYKMNY